MKIFSLNNVGDLTYPYEKLDGKTDTIKLIIENQHYLSKLINSSKKPLIIIGQSALNSKSGKYIFESIKSYLKRNKKINSEWNSLNIISENASTVGSLDLGVFNTIDGSNETLKKLEDHKFEIVYLLGQDSLQFKKGNEFIIYQGSHGDKGAEIADIILPGASYTEQDGYYTNLEGKLQKAYKATYPPGDAKEDWEILNDLAESINHRKLFNDKDELLSSMLNNLKLFKENNYSKNFLEKNDLDFISEEIKVNNIDYYYSNAIARSSKTMFNCRNDKISSLSTGSTGTEG
tara:strand:- start:882 stop:1751 length:870 start_codon:yes stop_codon:yes gene_type:complete